MVTNTKNTPGSLAALPPTHLLAIENAMSNILTSRIAFETYSQVVTRVPVPRPGEDDPYDTWWCKNSPDPEPGQEAFAVFKAFRDRFQNEDPNSHQFSLQLLEIVATLCHEIATSLHDIVEGGLRKLVVEEPPMYRVATSKYPPYLTLLSHPDYDLQDHYPRGSGDTVAYWAENRIFGGVCNNVFLDPIMSRDIFQLTEAQLQDLTRFLSGEVCETSKACIPFQAEAHANRVPPNEAVYFNIYRDQYDRESLAARIRPRCVVKPFKEEAGWRTGQYKKLWGGSSGAMG
ncbi:hypothetical protein N7492_000161 [Penicillium capsulatum]|uniref:Uncharacterized protein n=1 Tax=Penicillium capsulatum TaxID=69766 RepID=A0A9W9LYR3_9EURO|nr:hypothetical protein N7492_000161 [Penicillium capsulatum]KAJ6130774.1 hypothetical protein N7512_003554 [Penicillium capsulatum]